MNDIIIDPYKYKFPVCIFICVYTHNIKHGRAKGSELWVYKSWTLYLYIILFPCHQLFSCKGFRIIKKRERNNILLYVTTSRNDMNLAHQFILKIAPLAFIIR
jgi:hypothetical protein